MLPKEQAKNEILKLVQRFEEHKSDYLQSSYNETQTRRDFIDPFFRALGWDVDNKGSIAEAYREVIHEDKIKVSGHLKSPDYSFRVNGKRYFFVEAKRPFIDVRNDVEPAYQVKRYAWSAKLKISIVTNFEEFAVYDCTDKPYPTDKASRARIDYFTFQDYAEKFDFIWDTFSQEAVLEGKHDTYVLLDSKKGASSVDDDFLESLDTWRTLLAKDIFQNTPNLGENDLNFVVQHTIDRIIFLRIAEDRNIEFYGSVHNCLKTKNVYKNLFRLFEIADEKYNSGLFNFKKDQLSSLVKISNECLVEIIDNLYFPKSPYEFSVIPVEILGNAYEQFLSKTIQISSKGKIKIEEKPEVKKAGGVYYTPQYIVDYIVECTLGKIIEDKTPTQIEKIRILDPASGSGSFLLGAYDYLLKYHQKWYLKNASKSKGKKSDPLNPDGSLSTDVKKKILLNNIFGVDLDASAVEVTKLSLLLKCLEGETQASIKAQQSFFHDRVLPTLDENIKCGNSLIDTDFYEIETDGEVLKQTKPFNWGREFLSVFKQGGFDVIVGNPPYIRIQRVSHSNSDYFFDTYTTPTSKMDISLLFIERSFQLLKHNGLIGLICTSQWLNADYGTKLRKFLSTGKLHEIMDFGSLPVFKDASTYPAVLILSDSPKKELIVKKVATKEQLNYSDISNLKAFLISLESLSERPWSLGGIDILKGQLPTTPLSTYGKAYIGTKSGLNEAFVLTKKEAKEFQIEKKITLAYAHRGGEVESYGYLKPDSLIIYPYADGGNGNPLLMSESSLRRDFPNAYAYLFSKKSSLQKRQDSRKYYAKGDDWYRHLRAGTYHVIRSNKLVVKGISLRCNVGIFEGPSTFDGARCPCIIIEDKKSYSEEFFLAILNSKLATYYLKSICSPKMNNYIEFSVRALASFPIRVIDFSKSSEKEAYEKTIQYVKQLLKLSSSENSDRKIALHIESQIDKLVYELYGLNTNDIKTIEGAVDGNV